MRTSSRRRKKRDKKFQKIADSDFRSSVRIGEQHGLQVTRPAPEHYQIRKANDWIVNVYPTTGTIYPDKNKPGPPINVRQNWVLVDVVNALVPHAADEQHQRIEQEGYWGETLDAIKRELIGGQS